MSNKDDMDIKSQEEFKIEEEIKEETVLDKSEEAVEEKIIAEEDNHKNNNKEEEKHSEKVIVELESNPSFLKKLFASVLDQAVILGISAIILLIFDLVMGLFGYMIIEPTSILLIIYVIVNIFYLPLFERKNKRTIGKRILSIG